MFKIAIPFGLFYNRKVMSIAHNVRNILSVLPSGVKLVAAAKARTSEEIIQAVEAGVKIVGENYVQEAEAHFHHLGRRVKWHFIGHLQRNKVKRAVHIFDMIESVDSLELAKEIEKHCSKIKKKMPVLIEINSGRERQKFGVLPEETEALIREIKDFPHIQIHGLMTMGPFAGDPEEARPYFVKTRRLWDELKKSNLQGVRMDHLSMGMSNSYKVALEEGANIVRIGTKIFGPRI